MSELNQKEVNEQMYLFVKQWIDNMTFEESKKVPVMAIAYCLARLSKQDELLKEQEAQLVLNMGEQIGCKSGSCPKCGKMLNTTCNKRYCGNCGQAVKWG